MTNTRPLPAPTVTEATAKELITSIGELNTSMAVANSRLQDIAIKFDRQEMLNNDIEKRMKEREIDAVSVVGKIDSVKNAADLVALDHAARISAVEAWKKSVNGFLIAVGTAIGITIALGALYLIFGGAKP